MPSPLIRNMLEKHGYPRVNEENLERFLQQHEEAVLFFAENPRQFPESDDVAMILPELVKAFDNRFQAALVENTAEKALQKTYGFSAWPTLVFLRKGKYLGAISQVQNWDDYLREITEILDGNPVLPPGIGMTVVAETSRCH